MIKNSFIFLPGIGQNKEKNIHSQGIYNWNDFLNVKKIKNISKSRKLYYDRKIAEIKKELLTDNIIFLKEKIPQCETWRLYEYFKDDAVFLDIETSGVNGYLVMVGLYDRENTKTMLNGINLDFDQLKNELKKYKLIVTFNGSSFDIPFLKKLNKDLIPNIPHFDLKVACNKLDLKGGLKNIEKELNIKRENKLIEKLYGGDPLRLWKMFNASGDDHYLKLLIDYNNEDVINLKHIADYVCIKLRKIYINN